MTTSPYGLPVVVISGIAEESLRYPHRSAKTTKDKHAEMEWKPLHGQTTLRRPKDDTLRNSLSTPATASAIAGVDAFSCRITESEHAK